MKFLTLIFISIQIEIERFTKHRSKTILAKDRCDINIIALECCYEIIGKIP